MQEDPRFNVEATNFPDMDVVNELKYGAELTGCIAGIAETGMLPGKLSRLSLQWKNFSQMLFLKLLVLATIILIQWSGLRV